MAQRPDGKPAGVEKVAFTRPAAERIAKVVRTVESGRRDAEGYGLGYRLQEINQNQPAVRFCTWSATWGYAQALAVRFDPATNQTATATNVILGVGPGQGWVAKKGTASWCLIGFDMTQQPGYADQEIQLFGHNESAVAQWYSITTCSTATA